MQDLWRLLTFLLRLARDVRHARLRLLVVVVLGVASGPASAAVLALINRVLSRSDPASSAALLGFAGLCLAIPVFRFVSQAVLFDLSQTTMLQFRLQLSARVLRAPLRLIERIGSPRLLTVLATDIGTIVDSLALVPGVLMNLSLLVSCLAYLAWLDWRLLLRVLLYLGVIMVIYYFAVQKALRYLRRGRKRWDKVVGQIRSMVEGAKELKMHRRRRLAFQETIASDARSLLSDQRSGQLIYTFTSSMGQVLFYILVGLVVFVVPRFEPVSNEVLIGYAIILFNMLSPVEVFLASLPALSRAAVAVSAVEEMGISLQEERVEQPSAPAATIGTWDRLELAGITHTYHRGTDETFQLGPIDLTVRPGELIFLVGGNGSGKTTLAKLILGLYAPESGEVRFEGRVVRDTDREGYRENFSVVFSDFFLFESLLGLDGTNLDEEARGYLERLRLDHKVRVEGGALSTLDLSQGERKRLALLTAYLEDRPIYLFDEWAADQDPVFKKIFYLELLPELKRRQKAVFVITHDDHYFQVADRVIKLDCGRVEYDRAWMEQADEGGELPLDVGSVS